MRWFAPLLAAMAACVAPAEPARPPAPAAKLSDRLPRRGELPCFPCHSSIIFEKGPQFAHASIGHRDAGHCHRCHVGMGHHGRDIDQGACLACHEDGAPAPAPAPKKAR